MVLLYVNFSLIYWFIADSDLIFVFSICKKKLLFKDLCIFQQIYFAERMMLSVE